MSDSGESDDESERLSDLDAIAKALRAGELDAETRFGRKWGEDETRQEASDGRTPSEILNEVHSEGEGDRQRNDVDGQYEVDWEPNSRLDVLIRLQGPKEEVDRDDILREVVQDLVDRGDAPTNDEVRVIQFKDFPYVEYFAYRKRGSDDEIVVGKRTRRGPNDPRRFGKKYGRTYSRSRRGGKRPYGLERRRPER